MKGGMLKAYHIVFLKPTDAVLILELLVRLRSAKDFNLPVLTMAPPIVPGPRLEWTVERTVWILGKSYSFQNRLSKNWHAQQGA